MIITHVAVPFGGPAFGCLFGIVLIAPIQEVHFCRPLPGGTQESGAGFPALDNIWASDGHAFARMLAKLEQGKHRD
jgi:hypothetical protein